MEITELKNHILWTEKNGIKIATEYNVADGFRVAMKDTEEHIDGLEGGTTEISYTELNRNNYSQIQSFKEEEINKTHFL